MSYISQIATRRMALVARASMVQTPRQFSTSIAAQKSATEAVKDGLKTVDRKVSDKLVDGINASSMLGSPLKFIHYPKTRRVAQHGLLTPRPPPYTSICRGEGRPEGYGRRGRQHWRRQGLRRRAPGQGQGQDGGAEG